jgi:molecular chaperone DnaK (HSP70)
VADDVVIGIDLGTTNSCVCGVVDGQIRVFADETGDRIQASMVSFLEDGSRRRGQRGAPGAGASIRDRHIYSAKRLIGRHFDSKVVQAVAPGDARTRMVRGQAMTCRSSRSATSEYGLARDLGHGAAAHEATSPSATLGQPAK